MQKVLKEQKGNEMNENEMKQAVLDKLDHMNMCVVTCAEFLPDTYLSDMKELFGADPEKDTVSNVYWSTDCEGWITDGVVTVIDNVSRDTACQMLVKYAKEKDIAEWHLLFHDAEEGYVEMAYDSTGVEFYEGHDVMLSFDGAGWDGLFTLNVENWEQVDLGFKKA